MVLKALFLFLLIYFIFKTSARLIRAMQVDRPASRIDHGQNGTDTWHSNPVRRSYSAEDVEDAKYVDIQQ